MDKEFESIIKAVKNVTLTENEKVLMRTNLLDGLQNEDVIKSNPNRLYYYYQNLRSNYFMINRNKFIGAFVVVGIVFITGGASAFAEQALPGDLLYGVKVSVNEKVAGVFALTKEEKTEWKERLVERRLKEAHGLASSGKLDDIKRAGLEDKIKSQIDEFNVSVNELAKEEGGSEKSSDLNIRLQASLRAYQSVMDGILEQIDTDEDIKKETEKFIATLKESRGKTRDDHKNLESELGDDKGGDKKTTAENLLNSIKLLYQKEKLNLSTNIQNKIDAKFALAETSFGKNEYEAVIIELNSIKLLMLSNVIKGDIEDDHGIDNDEDIEDEYEDEDHSEINDDDDESDSNEIEFDD